MRRPLRTLLLLVLAGLPLLLIALADVVFVPVVEGRLEHRARAAAKSASVQADIGSFPVVGRALAVGEVASVDITWYGVAVGSMEATSLQLHLDGVGFDRGELFSGKARITGVESGDVRMLISASQLSRLFQRDVLIRGGEVRVRASRDVVVDVQVSATNRGLVLTAPGLEPVSAEVGEGQMPCAPGASVELGNLLLQCSFRGLPPILRENVKTAAHS